MVHGYQIILVALFSPHPLNPSSGTVLHAYRCHLILLDRARSRVSSSISFFLSLGSNYSGAASTSSQIPMPSKEKLRLFGIFHMKTAR
jgi:hypothetical protein